MDNPEEFANELMVIPAIDESIGIKVDFIFSFTPYERQAIARGNKIKLGTVEINFASLEDLIIHKIFAGRARDLEDIKNIILKNPDFNKEYILKWLREFEKSIGEDFTKRFLDI